MIKEFGIQQENSNIANPIDFKQRIWIILYEWTVNSIDVNLSLSAKQGYAQLGLVESETIVDHLQTLTVYLQQWSDRACTISP
jgi:hypothetical protein